jgi:protein TonB
MKRTLRLAIALVVAAGTALAAGGVKPKANAYFQTGFDDTAWQQAAFKKVVAGWKPTAAPAVGKKTVLIASISRDGALLGLREHMTTGVAGWDATAIEAVKQAAPFPKLPKSWVYPSLEVHFHFEAGK